MSKTFRKIDADEVWAEEDSIATVNSERGKRLKDRETKRRHSFLVRHMDLPDVDSVEIRRPRSV